MTDFLDTVAANSKTVRAVVHTIFNEAGVVLTPATPAPHSLRITRVQFLGTKHRADHDPEPFDYNRTLDSGLWVVASQHNLAGKSTVLNVIRWALTGRSQLRSDVRSWIGHVELEGRIDDRPFSVVFDDDDSKARGTLTDASAEVGRFESDEAFETLLASFFTNKLGFEPAPFWQKRPGGLDSEGDASQHGWLAYFQAMHVRSGAGPLIGDSNAGGQPALLLQVFLGLPWSMTLWTSRVALLVARRELSAGRRRSRDDAKVRANQRKPLQGRLEKAHGKLKEIDSRTRVLSAVELDALVAAYQTAVSRITQLDSDLRDAQMAVALAHEDADGVLRKLNALRETAAVKPLLGRIRPSECPQCAHHLDDFRAARQAQEHCYVCNAPIGVAAEDLDAEAEAEAEFNASSEALAIARKHLQQLRDENSDASRTRDEARIALTSAEKARPVTAEREAALREIAVCEALLAQDDAVTTDEGEHAALERIEAVLAAAQAEAEKRRGAVVSGFLERLAIEIADLGRRFGIDNLEAVDPKLGGQMKVKTGGVDSNFGDLTAGEQLRLRIANLVGLLRIGESAGIGRFPGLLLIDSPASEEMVDADAGEILGELAKLASELPGLQMIVATARPELITGVPEEQRLGAADLGLVF